MHPDLSTIEPGDRVETVVGLIGFGPGGRGARSIEKGSVGTVTAVSRMSEPTVCRLLIEVVIEGCDFAFDDSDWWKIEPLPSQTSWRTP